MGDRRQEECLTRIHCPCIKSLIIIVDQGPILLNITKGLLGSGPLQKFFRMQSITSFVAKDVVPVDTDLLIFASGKDLDTQILLDRYQYFPVIDTNFFGHRYSICANKSSVYESMTERYQKRDCTGTTSFKKQHLLGSDPLNKSWRYPNFFCYKTASEKYYSFDIFSKIIIMQDVNSWFLCIKTAFSERQR